MPEKLSDQLKREFDSLATNAKLPEDMTAAEVFALYRDAGGEIHTEAEIAAAMVKPEVWLTNLREQLATGFRFVAGVWRRPTQDDLNECQTRWQLAEKSAADYAKLHGDMGRRIGKAAAVQRMAELKTLITDAEAQERIQASYEQGQREQAEREEKQKADAEALARFQASEAKAAGGGAVRTSPQPPATGKTEVLSAEVTAGKPVGGDRETMPAPPPANAPAVNDTAPPGDPAGLPGTN